MRLSVYSAAATLLLTFALVIPATAQQNKSTLTTPTDQRTAGSQSLATQKQVPKSAPAPIMMEQTILEEINFARRNPQEYVRILEEYRKSFKGNIGILPNNKRVIATNEGTVPVDEAIAYLKTLPGLQPYTFAIGLNKAAGLHLKDLMINPSIGHVSINGDTVPQRLAKFGTSGPSIAENIAYRTISARGTVLGLIVDDGVPSRGHRKNIFSQSFNVIGIAYGTGNNGDGICVMDFADFFTELNNKSPVPRRY
jgi:uncharacterized protein YkwD